MANPLANKNILITGAGRGIGKRLAMGLAARGARVGLLARSKAEIDLAKLEIEYAGGQALHLRADVRELDQLQAQAEALKRLQAETVIELNALMPAILDRAFKGEL